MYDIRFVDAKNHKGKLLRDKKTGNLLEYCPHIYITKPTFDECEEVASGLYYSRKIFTGLQGVCQICGDVLIISANNMANDEEEYGKMVEEAVKELGK